MSQDFWAEQVALLEPYWQRVFGSPLLLTSESAPLPAVSAQIASADPPLWLVGQPAMGDASAARALLEGWATLLSQHHAGQQQARNHISELENRIRLHQRLGELVKATADPWELSIRALRLAITVIEAENGFVAQVKDGAFRHLAAFPLGAAQVETLVRRMDASGLTLVCCPQDDGCDDLLADVAGVRSLMLKRMRLKNGSDIFAAVINHRRAGTFDERDVELFQVVSDQVRVAIDVIALSEQRHHAELVQRELELAEQVQSAFLPAHLPDLPGYEVAAKILPASRVSGDFYDVYVSPERIGLLVCDVSGKGISGALLASNVRVVARVQLALDYDPGEALQGANAVLFDDMSRTDHFATGTLIATQPNGDSWSYANAGHTTGFLVRAATLEILRLPSLTLPLGIEREIPAVTEQFVMAPSDVLVLYSDGLSEAAGSQGRLVGMSGILHVVLACRNGPAGLIVDSLAKLVAHYRGAQPLEDDVTVMVVRRKGQDDARLHVRFAWELAADLSAAWQVERDLERLRPFLAETDAANTWLLEVELALTELFNNIVQYAYAGTENEVIHGLIALYGDRLEIDMVDRGTLYVPQPEPAVFDPLEPTVGGYGMRIIRQVMDTVDIKAADNYFNCWHLVRTIPVDFMRANGSDEDHI